MLKKLKKQKNVQKIQKIEIENYRSITELAFVRRVKVGLKSWLKNCLVQNKNIFVVGEDRRIPCKKTQFRES
jgi:hypothetical protein